jgi:hypothetical protein
MKIPFRIKIQLLYQKLINRNLYTTPLVKIGKDGRGVENILFFLPSEKNSAQVISHFIKRNSKNSSLNFKYVLHQESLIHYESIPNSDIITYTDNDINWFGTIKTGALIDRIGDEGFDALVDLNQSFDQCLSLLSLQLKIPIKVGFESPISDHLFSVVIQPAENSFLESNYQTIEGILGMSTD